MGSKFYYLALFAAFGIFDVDSFAFGSNDNISIIEVNNDHRTMVAKDGIDIISHACMTYEEIYKKYEPIEISFSDDGYRLFLDNDEFLRGDRCWIHIIKQSSHIGSSN